MSLTEGTYKARAVEGSARFGMAKTGTEQIGVVFDILDAEGAPSGDQIVWYGSFGSEAANKLSLTALRNAGWTCDSITDLEGLGSVDVELVLAMEQDLTGADRLKVKWVNRVGGRFVSFTNVMDEGQKKAFAARMKGAILAGPKPPRAAPSAPAARTAPKAAKPAEWDGTGPDPADGDLPF